MLSAMSISNAVLISFTLAFAHATAAEHPPCRGWESDPFDQTPPPAIRDRVQNSFADFEWGSDYDSETRYSRIANFVWNRGRKTLGPVKWPKGEIKLSSNSAIPPGEAFCVRFFAPNDLRGPDFDSPIIYGENDQVQVAAAFVRERQSASIVGGEFTWSFLDRNGAQTRAGVQILSRPETSEDVSLFIAFSPELTLVVPRFGQRLGPARMQALARDAFSQGGRIDNYSMLKLINQDSERLLRSEFGDADVSPFFGDDVFVFRSKTGKLSLSFKSAQSEPVTFEVLVLSPESRPLVLASFDIFAPVQ